VTRIVCGRPIRWLAAATLVVALAAGLAACSAGGRSTPAATVAAPASAAAESTPSLHSTPRSTPPRPGATEVPGPPVATLVGARPEPVAGELGTFTWDGLGSDAPWIVPPHAVPVTAGAALAVTTDPTIVPARWTARWARVVDGSAGDPVTVTAGTGATLTVAAPHAAGAWGLQVEITFAEGRSGAWYWSITVAP
jgi:hypothetical protein